MAHPRGGTVPTRFAETTQTSFHTHADSSAPNYGHRRFPAARYTHVLHPQMRSRTRSSPQALTADLGGDGRSSFEKLRSAALDADLAKVRATSLVKHRCLASSLRSPSPSCSFLPDRHPQPSACFFRLLAQIGEAVLPKRLTAGKLAYPIVLQARVFEETRAALRGR